MNANENKSTSSGNLIWIDLEMTGLATANDNIIEIATIVTDKQLNELAEGPVLAIHQSQPTMDAMDEWNTRQHGESGLTARVLASEVTAVEAERRTLEFLSGWVESGASPMCGNSICQDRRFLYKYMPELSEWMHYRNIDVSSIKELAKRWAPELITGFTKRGTHKALDDIYESIEELKFYREHLFVEVMQAGAGEDY